MNKRICRYKKGFTLLELLVVIAIIAVIVAVGVANFVGARQKARDIRKKAEMQQVKNALRLYFNDWTTYPTIASSNDLLGCGSGNPPSASCLSACGGQFAAGGTGCDTMYMKLLPPQSDYEWWYAPAAGGDDFCLSVVLDAGLPTEITKSHARCTVPCSGVSASRYVECAD